MHEHKAACHLYNYSRRSTYIAKALSQEILVMRICYRLLECDIPRVGINGGKLAHQMDQGTLDHSLVLPYKSKPQSINNKI